MVKALEGKLWAPEGADCWCIVGHIQSLSILICVFLLLVYHSSLYKGSVITHWLAQLKVCRLWLTITWQAGAYGGGARAGIVQLLKSPQILTLAKTQHPTTKVRGKVRCRENLSFLTFHLSTLRMEHAGHMCTHTYTLTPSSFPVTKLLSNLFCSRPLRC